MSITDSGFLACGQVLWKPCKKQVTFAEEEVCCCGLSERRERYGLPLGSPPSPSLSGDVVSGWVLRSHIIPGKSEMAYTRNCTMPTMVGYAHLLQKLVVSLLG